MMTEQEVTQSKGSKEILTERRAEPQLSIPTGAEAAAELRSGE